MVIDMISQLGRHSLYQFIIGCEDASQKFIHVFLG